MAAGRRYHDVVWDDEDVDVPLEAERPPWRPSRRLVGAVAVVVALAGTGTLVVDRVREARVDERLARTAGLSEDLGRPLVTSWSAEGDTPRVLDDLVLVHRERTTAAIGLADGAVRYEVNGACSPTTPPGAVPPDEALVVCELYVGDGEGPGYTRVVVRGATTGEELHAFTVPAAGGGSSVTAGYLVEHRLDLGGRFDVTARDLRTGAEAWTYDGRDGIGFPGVYAWSSSLDEVVLEISGRRVRFDAATGDVREGEAPIGWADGGTAQHGAGWVARQVLDDEGAPAVRLATSGRGGGAEESPGPLLPGVLAVTEVDDGTAPDLVVVVEDGDGSTDVVARDPVRGAERWRASVPRGGTWAQVVAGRLVVGTSDGVVALDAATGAELWRATTAGDARRGHVTDGRRVMVLEPGAAGPSLVVRAVDDGRLVWSAPLDPARDASDDGHRSTGGAGELRRAPDGSVVVSDGSTVTRLVPPG